MFNNVKPLYDELHEELRERKVVPADCRDSLDRHIHKLKVRIRKQEHENALEWKWKHPHLVNSGSTWFKYFYPDVKVTTETKWNYIYDMSYGDDIVEVFAVPNGMVAYHFINTNPF